MSNSILDENTLGVAANRAARQRERRPTKSLRDFGTSTVPGTSFLGIGIALVSGLLIVYGFTRFLVQWSIYPTPWLGAAAWGLLAVTLISVGTVVRLSSERLPDFAFYGMLASLAVVFTLDLIAVWPLDQVGMHATAAIAVGAALLSVVTVRGSIEILIAVGVLTAAMVIVTVLSYSGDILGWATQISAIAVTALPGLLGVLVVRNYRRMLQVELDRVMIQSTVSGPRFAVGMLASEQLARLDLAAEQLLDGVASGRVRLPLKPEIASTAASLATELRLHLLEGRRETWLYHAVTESEFLGNVVNVVDANSLAGLLDPSQRDGLLSAIWLMASSSTKADLRVETVIGPVAVGDAPTGKLSIPIVIRTTGVRRNRIDPTTWDALAKTGSFVDSNQGASVHVKITCYVDNPAEL